MRVEILNDQPVSPNLQAGERGVACAFPQAAALKHGRVACVYRRGATKHSYDGVFMVQFSDDLGVTWDTPRLIFDGRARQPAQTVVSGGVCQTPAGALIATFSTVEGLQPDAYMFDAHGMTLPRWVFVTRSEDGGETWGEPARIDTSPYTSVGITTKPFLLPNGELFVPIEAGTSRGVQSSFAVVSSDDGRTFGPLITCADDVDGQLSLCDARFTTLPDGRLLMLLWTFRREDEETIAVRRSYSADGGRSWTLPESTGILGQITMPLALPSGAVIAVSNYRLPPEGSRLWYSPDGGQTWDLDRPIQMWDAQRRCVLGAPVPAEPAGSGLSDSIWQALGRFTFGTPDLVALSDGSILLTYYATLDDIIHVRACRFRVLDVP